PLVRLTGVSRRFGSGAEGGVALDDVTLDVPAAALTLVMGPSGSGKTTLLAVTGGLLSPTTGSVEVAGTPLGALTPAALAAFRLQRVGIVYQRFRLLDGLTALENIELPLNLAGVWRPASRERARALAARVGLERQLDVQASALSGGEQQRVAIARALANDPPVLLADEPTGSLDSRSGQRIIELLHAAAVEQGCAVLVASHDARLLPYAERVVWLEDGRVGEGGPPMGAARKDTSA
ncbi:MAG TPA: ABC transporter ATP-binding protein, partial [Gemmatimonadaceae bacterium]|nr:ABC transporter ATP-binding protein [Gemmatimonadaceae bacterium]